MKKKRLLLSALLICMSSAVACALPVSDEFRPYFTAAQSYDVHAEKSLVSPIVSAIRPGDAVFITGGGPTELIDGMHGTWLQVAHGPGDKVGSGYIFGDVFLNNDSLLHGTTSFILERKLVEEHGLAEISLKALDPDGNLLAASKPVTTIAARPLLMQPLAGNGLSGVHFILRLDVSGETCGTPDCTYYYAWTGTDLALLPSAIDLGGAGMDVAYNETLIFPAGGAPSDTILKVVRATEYFNESEEDDRIKDVRHAARIYSWDGKRAVPQPEEPELFDWFRNYLEKWHYGRK